MRKKIKVILLQDIPEIGHKYETAEVAIGYFRNHLSLNNLAEVATDEILDRLEGERKEAEEERKKRIEENKKKAEKLENKTIHFPVKVGDGGQVYGSVTVKDVEDKLSEMGYEETEVNLNEHLKDLGDHQVWIDFGDDVQTSVNVVLEKEN